MSRSTFSGPVNSGKKTTVLDSNTVYRTQVGTAILAQTYTVTIAAGETKKTAFVLPKNAKLRAINRATTATTGGTSLTLTVGSTDGGVDYVASADVKAVTVPAAATLVAAGYAALTAPTSDKLVYVSLVSVGHVGVVDVVMEYYQFADSTQVIVAPKV
jgi:hypothetical protein